MVSSCIKYLFLLQSVSARDANACKVPSSSEALVLFQRLASKQHGAPGHTCLSDGEAVQDELITCASASLDQLPNAEQTMNGSMWVLHYSGYVDRKNHLLDILNQEQITKVNWLEAFDKERMPVSTCECLFTSDYETCGEQVRYGAANGWSQYALFYHVVKNSIPYVFVMEDDPVFPDDTNRRFKAGLDEIMMKASRLPGGFDMIHFGGCFNIHGRTPQSPPLYDHPRDSFGRCTNGYVVSLNGAKKMLATFRKGVDDSHRTKIYDNVDWMFNYIGKDPLPGCAQLDVYLVEPPIFDNGSTPNKKKEAMAALKSTADKELNLVKVSFQ